jgi:general secretion pathway protein D
MISWRRIAGTVLILALTGCAAERLHRDGLAAIDKGQYESGVTLLAQAVQSEPHNMSYRLDLEARREAAVQRLVALADTARVAHQLDVAALDYKRVLAIDPNNDRAQHGLAALEGDARHGDVVAQARKDFERKDYDAADAKLRSVLNEDPGYTLARALAAEINVARGPVTVAPRLKTRENRKVTLQLRDAQTKMVFEVLQRETGINFILDKDIKSDGKTTIFVQDVPVEEAIDLVLDQNALARQILASNMVLIYPNNPAKHKEYQEEIVRTFYLTNAAPKEVESMLKSVLGAKTLFIDERTDVVVMRDTPDNVRMAEKLVTALDVSEPEVMLEVEVLEISRSRLQDLGITYPTTATLAVTPLGTGAAAASNLVLSDLRHQNSHTITVTPLSVTLNAMKQSGLANTLASPRIRARSKEKAKILIGSRVPVITNSVTPTNGGTAVVTGSVQYLDVGLTLEVQPTVHLDNDVAIKIALEVSSITKEVTTSSGTVAYQISTRNANTLLELKDGETQILAGLIQDQDTRTANTIPGLGDIPIVGRLFGSHHSDTEKDEVVLSITPRIIRMRQRPASDTTEFWYGTESRTRSAPYAATSSDKEPGSVPASNVQPALPLEPPAESMSAPQGMPLTAPPAAIAPSATQPPASSLAAPQAAAQKAASEPSAAVPAPIAAGAAAESAARAALSIEGPANARVGEEFQAVVHLSSAQAITRLRSQVRFDATTLQLISATAGDMVPAAAGSPTVDARSGGAQLEVVASSEDPVQGEGGLMVLRFKALAPRPSTSIAAQVSVVGSAGAAVGNSAAPALNIAIQP